MTHACYNELDRFYDAGRTFLTVIFGSKNCERWMKVKSRAGCVTESQFVHWLLDVAEKRALNDDGVPKRRRKRPLIVNTERLTIPAEATNSPHGSTCASGDSQEAVQEAAATSENITPTSQKSNDEGGSEHWWRSISCKKEAENDAVEENEHDGRMESSSLASADLAQTTSNSYPPEDLSATAAPMECFPKFPNPQEDFQPPPSDARTFTTDELTASLSTQKMRCNMCPRMFSDQLSLTNHVNRHYDRKHCCQFCSKAFYCNNDRVKHERIHTGEKPYKCDYCDKAFTQNGAKNSHMRRHFGERPFVCPQCSKGYPTFLELQRHCDVHVAAACGGQLQDGGNGHVNLTSQMLGITDSSMLEATSQKSTNNSLLLSMSSANEATNQSTPLLNHVTSTASHVVAFPSREATPATDDID